MSRIRRSGWLKAAQQQTAVPDYDGMDRAALVTEARSRGILVGGRWKVETIIAKLRETD